MRRIFSIYLVITYVLLSLLATACNSTTPPPNQTNQGTKVPPKEIPKPPQEKPVPSQEKPALTLGDYFPLITGYSWEYAGEGNEYAAFNRKVMFKQGKLAQIKEDNGGTVSASVFETSAEAITRIFFQAEEYGETNHLNSKPNQNLVILKTPLQVGTKWTQKTETREIVDLNATVTTPAGSFDKCLKVKITHQDSIINEYFKVGVGMVKQEFISGEARVTSSLKKFTKP